MSILEIQHLQKKFGGNEVIKDLNLSISEHKVFGFIGKNGAGKTTTMKMILGLLKPDQGKIKLCQEEVTYGQTKTNRFVGYLPDVPEYYGFMTPMEYLELCGKITGMKRSAISAKSIELIHMVGLEDAKKKRIGGFSRGMKQRLGIAQALLNEPRLLICDEPTSALDPVGRKEILNILQTVRKKTTVLFSTHILSDVERICDDIAILHEGEIALTGTLDDIKNQYSHDRLKLEFYKDDDLIKFQELFMNNELQSSTAVDNRMIVIQSKEIERVQKSILKLLYDHQLLPLSLERQEPALEHVFLEVVK